jgi:hypothetical protein
VGPMLMHERRKRKKMKKNNIKIGIKEGRIER